FALKVSRSSEVNEMQNLSCAFCVRRFPQCAFFAQLVRSDEVQSVRTLFFWGELVLIGMNP
ncbi:MAG TPA: hypothetical protein VLN58_08195, partial [Verrucomicrobiae bacterium]|nr:hypothetical protein [Verrucomicrobiae bacterium]